MSYLCLIFPAILFVIFYSLFLLDFLFSSKEKKSHQPFPFLFKFPQTQTLWGYLKYFRSAHKALEFWKNPDCWLTIADQTFGLETWEGDPSDKQPQRMQVYVLGGRILQVNCFNLMSVY